MRSGPSEDRNRGRGKAAEGQPEVAPQGAPAAGRSPAPDRQQKADKPNKNKKGVEEASPTPAE